MGEMRVIPVRIQGEVHAGDSLVELLAGGLRGARQTLRAGDIVIVKHKIVSKAEGQFIDLNTIQPSRWARAWARRYARDARVIELALREAKGIVRRKHG